VIEEHFNLLGYLKKIF